MGILEKLSARRFWYYWSDRFRDNSNTYITPNNERVKEEVSKLKLYAADSDIEKAIITWRYVNKEIVYSLSKEWKTPEETLNEGIGDCEDITFLLASMFPNMGIIESELAIGNLHFGDGRISEHTWNVVDGKIIDGTTQPEEMDGLKYEPVNSFIIRNKQTGVKANVRQTRY